METFQNISQLCSPHQIPFARNQIQAFGASSNVGLLISYVGNKFQRRIRKFGVRKIIWVLVAISESVLNTRTYDER
jgi:hypothetical protein